MQQTFIQNVFIPNTSFCEVYIVIVGAKPHLLAYTCLTTTSNQFSGLF